MYEKKTYQSTSLKPFIQITDNRGTGAGWKVTAAASSFNDGTKDTLSGAVITFNNGEVVSPTTGVAGTNTKIIRCPFYKRSGSRCGYGSGRIQVSVHG